MMPSGPHGVGHFDREVAERLGSIVPPDRPGSAVGQEARGQGARTPKWPPTSTTSSSRRGSSSTPSPSRTCTPRRHCWRRSHATTTLVDLVNRRSATSCSAVPTSTSTPLTCCGHLPEHRDRDGIRQHDDPVAGGHPARGDGEFVFDPRSPYVVFWVIDPDTGEQVPYGERGQVVMNHVSKGMFIPNNLERDTAIRMPDPTASSATRSARSRRWRCSAANASSRACTDHATSSHSTRSGPTANTARAQPQLVSDTRGEPVAELSVVPRLYVTRSVSAQRRGRPAAARRARRAALKRLRSSSRPRRSPASSFDDYVALTCRVIRPADVRRTRGCPRRRRIAGHDLRRGAARPAGRGRARLARRRTAAAARSGRAAATCSPSTHPATRQACTGCGRRRSRSATGSRSGRRGGNRSPRTESWPRCVRPAFSNEDALFLPTDHSGADDLVRAADLAMVYGGQDVADRYAGDPTVLVNGPGRTKILITAECDWR